MATKEKRKEIHSVLSQLEKQGRLTPDEVVEEAKSPDSPLHDHFTWDVEAAARATWLNEARALISSFTVSIVVHEKEYNIQEFVENPAKPERQQGYYSIQRIRSRKSLARDFLEAQLTIANSYVRKTTEFAEVLGLRHRVDDVIRDIDDLRGEAGKQPEA